MLDIKVTRKINKPIDEVWRFVVDDFTTAHRWAFGTTSCRAGTDSEDFDRVCDAETGRLEDTMTRIDNGTTTSSSSPSAGCRSSFDRS